MADHPPPRPLQLRYPGRCVVCGRDLAVGELAMWHPGRHVVACVQCPLGASASDNNAPGASARREYDRKHVRRADHARKTLGVLGVLLARVIEEPATTKAWKRGAEGEERVGARLEELLADSGVRLLHARRMPGRGSANIDHIAVGPGGVTVIDTKNCRGKVRTDRVGGLFVPRHDVLLIAGRDRTGLIRKIERQVDAVRKALGASVEVRGAMCFADVNGLPLLRSLRVNEIVVDGPKPVARLAGRPGPLSSEDVTRLVRQLASRLQPA